MQVGPSELDLHGAEDLPGRPRHGLLIAAALLLWLALVGCAMGALVRYKSTPGEAGVAPSRYPSGALIPLDPERVTVVMFAHPFCPCTSASLEELETVATRARDRMSLHVVFAREGASDAELERAATLRRAKALSGVRVHLDDGGEARRFDARTSGYVVAYGADEGLLFAGGITSLRGHAGDSEGRRRLLSVVAGGGAEHSSVFGCGLADRNSGSGR
jgi:hypothetical protein